MLPKMFKKLEAKWSAAVHRDQATHPLTRVYALAIKYSVFSVKAVEMPSVLFSIWNGVKISEYETYQLTIFH